MDLKLIIVKGVKLIVVVLNVKRVKLIDMASDVRLIIVKTG